MRATKKTQKILARRDAKLATFFQQYNEDKFLFFAKCARHTKPVTFFAKSQKGNFFNAVRQNKNNFSKTKKTSFNYAELFYKSRKSFSMTHTTEGKKILAQLSDVH